MSSFKASRPGFKPKASTKSKNDANDDTAPKGPSAVYVNKNAVIDDAIDDGYGTTNVKGIQGKWKNISLVADTQLNADSNMLKGLVCIQVCDENEFKALRQPEVAKKKAASTTKTAPAPVPAPTNPTTTNKTTVAQTKADATKQFEPEPKKLTKAQQKELELLKKVSGGTFNPKFAKFDDSSDSDDDSLDIKSTTQQNVKQNKVKTMADAVKEQLAQKKKLLNTMSNRSNPAVPTPKSTNASTATKKQEKPQQNATDAGKMSKMDKIAAAVKKASAAPNPAPSAPSPAEPTKKDDSIGVLEWFDDLSDDEHTKKTKQEERKKKLARELQKRLDAEKLKMIRSLNDEFEEMNDVDEDDEFETVETYGDDDQDEDGMEFSVEEADESGMEMAMGSDSDNDDRFSSPSSGSFNPLASLVQFSGSDEDDDGESDSEMIKPLAVQNEKVVAKESEKKQPKTTKAVATYYTKIAPHMFPPQTYLETTIQAVEEDEQDDLSSALYYSSPNATLFHYHQDYLSWVPFNLHPFIQLSLIREKFTSPRQIQAESLLPALRDRKDIVGIAQTGSGKTLAFLFPILQHIIEERDYRGELESVWLPRQKALRESEIHGLHFKDHLSAVVITPTRELAMQIADQVKLFGSIAMIKPTLIVGGIFLEKQLRLVSQNSPLIIGTPGRIWDVMKQFGSPVDLTFLRFLVLDEADRMVAAGHFEELNNIIDLIKMATTRRKQDSERVQRLLLERQAKLKDAIAQDAAREAVEQTKTTTTTTIKRKTPPAPTTSNDSDDDETVFNDNKKFKPNRGNRNADKKRIDFGPVFADADSFDLDKYLENIEKQRRGNAVESKKNGTKGKKGEASAQSKAQTKAAPAAAQTQKKGSKKAAAAAAVLESESEDEAMMGDDDDEDEDDELAFLNDTTMDDEDPDEMAHYIESDMDLDDVLDSEEEGEDEDEEAQSQQNNNNNNTTTTPAINPSIPMDPDQLVQLDESTEGRMRLDDALIEKHCAFTNRVPQKLQVFLFSATLALQDGAREHESKKLKLSARELSQKQGLIKPKKGIGQAESTAEELAERQRQEDLVKQREQAKTRLVQLSKRLTLDSPQIIDLTSALILPPTLQQYSIELADVTSRDQALYGLLYNQEDLTAIVFVNSVHMTRKIADFLRYLNVNAVALHGDTDQKGRISVIEKFRKTCAQVHKERDAKQQQNALAGFEDRELQARGLPTSSQPVKQVKGMNMKKYGAVLVCTDIVARGLDIPNLDLVVHYHVPYDAETYIHRCGRTARGTNFGKSVVIVSPEEDQQWRIIQHTLHVGLGRDEQSLAAASQELESIIKNPKDRRQFSAKSVVPANVADVKKIAFNSKYLVHIRERLRYAHQLAESKVEEKNMKKEQVADARLRDALGFEDDNWELSKKEKNRLLNETDGFRAYEANKNKNALKKAKFELNFLLKQRIFTQGGSFQW